MSKMLVVLTALWARAAVAARPSADRLLDPLSTDLWSQLPGSGFLKEHFNEQIEKALKDLGIKATEKQRDEVDERLSRAGIGQESIGDRQEYVKLGQDVHAAGCHSLCSGLLL